ncbi:hypothetical protein PRZ48_008190 [Zasmidium cellare]|uniref:PEBP-like protein n=1 Tax=Zasmidium cellare TaxID=395010 RepID=A0ABR0EER6_ZASCE|nr:hypothetical protein PRZ48_008190 [Zasmidium cellare]
MKAIQSIAVFATLALVNAQTPSNFSDVSPNPLDVQLNPTNITLSPGQLVSQNDVQDSPSLALSNSSNVNYVAFMIDPTSRSGTYLQWLQPNLIADTTGKLTVDTTATGASSAVGATYDAPDPPTDDYAHEYVILLYQQPANWAIPRSYSSINPPPQTRKRIGFVMADFQQAAGLDAPVGANYFRVFNGSPQATSSLSAVPTDSGAPATASGTLATTTGSSTSAPSASSSSGANTAALRFNQSPSQAGLMAVLLGLILV